jgi:acetyltransferase-like isoleucine patch superfamily enzyme
MAMQLASTFIRLRLSTTHCSTLSSGDITVGQHAFFGHSVAILTGTRDFTKFGAERQVAVPMTGRDVVIGEGVWLSSFAIVVGPCSIGEPPWWVSAPWS